MTLIFAFILFFALVAFVARSRVLMASPKSIVDGTKAVISRFPFAVGAALVALGLSSFLIFAAPHDEQLFRLLFVITIGISLFTALALLAEAHRALAPFLALLGAAALALFYLFSRDDTSVVFATRVAQLSLATHLFVAFAPFLASQNVSQKQLAFWDFNRQLLGSFVVAGCYSVLIFIGITIALAAINFLLGIYIDFRIYWIVLYVLMFGFNTILFLSNVPLQPAALKDEAEFSPGLSGLMHYVFIPFAMLDLGILYLYLGKIVFLASLPKGTVAWLICTFCVFGTIVWLLAFAARENLGRWLDFFRRRFFIVLLPLLALLAVAIWMRVSEYGITERRYLLIVLNAWLALTAVYFALGRGRDIRIIPISLCVIALLSLGGPWGAYAVSRNSQLARVAAKLAAADVSVPIRDGTRVSADVPFEIVKEISSALDYLVSTHGASSIRTLFDDHKAAIQLIDEELKRRQSSATGDFLGRLLATVGLRYVESYRSSTDTSFSLYGNGSAPGSVITVSDHEFFIRGLSSYGDVKLMFREAPVQASYEGGTLTFTKDGAVLCIVSLNDLVRRIYDESGKTLNLHGPIPPQQLHQKIECDRASLVLFPQQFNGEFSNETFEVRSFSVDALLREKRAHAPPNG